MVSFVENPISRSIIDQNKKVFLVAMAIFAVIAGTVALFRHKFQAKIGPVSVYFIASHGGPAAHFAAFSQYLDPAKYRVSILATGAALKKFQESGVQATEFNSHRLNLEQEDAQKALAPEVAKICSTAQMVITDVGHAFSKHLHQALTDLKLKKPPVHLSYYDNPEDFVPGGYSKVAEEVMGLSDGVLFANANLAEATLYEEDKYGRPRFIYSLRHKQHVGVGYYPLEQAEKIRQMRLEKHQEARAKFLAKHHLSDKGQKILVYFGGNNSEYFNFALPAFAKIIEDACKIQDLSDTIIVLQQHPGAKAKNKEQDLLTNLSKASQAPFLAISDFSSDDAQILADAALYYQTSMAPQFALARIPVMQIGHETYRDVLVKNDLCSSVTSAPAFIITLSKMFSETNSQSDGDQKVWKGLGIQKNWKDNLQKGLDSFLHPKRLIFF
jgi:hypothetical protein